MKKQYINPSVQVVGISLMRMLAGSPVEVDPNATGDQRNAEARQYYGDFD